MGWVYNNNTRLKHAFKYLGVAVLQLSNSCLEWIKTWRNYNNFWESIPLNNSQRKGVFIGVLVIVNWTKCHWIAVPGYSMSGLDILGKGHGHEAIPNFVKETETGHRSSLFECLPAQPVHQWRDDDCSGIIIHGLPGFNLAGILLGVGVPYSWSVLQLGTAKGLICHFPEFGGLRFYFFFDKSKWPVGVWDNSVHISVAA